MCGRYAITTAPEAIRQLFGYLEQPNFPPRYNVAPTQAVPIVRMAEGKRQLALVRWGLIPAWVKDALLECYEVSRAVNRTANDSAALLEPLREPEPVESPKPKPPRKEKAKLDDGQASLF